MYSLIRHGRRSIIDLQKKCGKLSVSVKLLRNESAFSNTFSSTSSVVNESTIDGRKGKSFTVSYLIDSLGLTAKLAESISRKASFEEKGNPDSVLSLLRSYGFTDSQISIIVTDYPQLLIVDAEKSLGPKLKFLHSRGASSSELTEIVSKLPKILGKKEGKSMSRYYDCVKQIIEADKSSKLEKLCHSLPQGSQQENKIRNMLVLRELGVPQKTLFSLLISNFSTVCGKERFEESLNKVVEMGFAPTTSKFIEALNNVYQMSDKTIEVKVNVYKRLGFAEEDVWAIFKKCPISLRHSEMKILNSLEAFVGLGFSRDEFVMMVKRFPQCIGLSPESVKKKTEYLVKKMNWPLKNIVLFPQCLGYSMEKRIVPRCNVIKALISKGLLGGSEIPPMPSIFACADEEFVNRYVMMYDDKHLVLELMAILTKSKTKASE